jgi:hypothetical protein
MKKIFGKFPIFFQKILALLRVHATGAGLEISDEVLRLARFDGKAWQMHAIRLTPGVMEHGKIKNREALIAALAALKAKLGRSGGAKKINVVVSLGSVEAYTQVFTLPVVQGDSLEQAVALNLQMASPLEAGESYSGWQIVGRNENTVQLEILSAFVDRKVVDELADALFEAGFLAMAVESKALALTRVLREKGAGIEAGKPYLFVNLGNAGLDFLIIRNGELYFEYMTAWSDLADDKGEIAIAKFETTFATNLKQVLNFYNQHWTEPLTAIILSAIALEDEAERVIAESTSLPAVRLTLVMGQPISSEWLMALGSSLRGVRLKTKHYEINLLGDDSRDRFHEEQLLHFMRFWRVVVPVTLALLVITFGVADAFLASTKNQIESRSVNLGSTQSSEIATLEDSAKRFNRLVGLVKTVESMQDPKNVALAAIADKAKDLITINRVTFQAFSVPITLSGTAPSEDRVIAFRAALDKDRAFSGINLPLTGIQTNGASVSFSMSFLYTPPPRSF